MAEIRVPRIEQGQTKIKNVPIAVTPEGFWCCPSPVVFQKTLKAQNPLNKSKSSSPPPKAAVQKKQALIIDKKPALAESGSQSIITEDRKYCPDSPRLDREPRPKIENVPKKVSIEFGEPGTSDVKLILLGKQGICVKLSVHKNVLVANSHFFADKFLERGVGFSCLEIEDCEDVEIYVETVGLMYSKEMRQRLIKQSVARVIRILKVAEILGFKSCMQSCLDYLEAVPWVGDEEEERVVSSVLRLQRDGLGVTPVLKRVSSDVLKPQNDTLSHVIELVLKSSEERSRREMKSLVLKLLRENNNGGSSSNPDLCNETIYGSCRKCLASLLSLFKQGADEDFRDSKEPLAKKIALDADNLSWLFEILADGQAADEFALMWANQEELSALHRKLPVNSRYHVSCITGRVFIGIGKGELLPSKETRQLLLQTWLEPLMNDYGWLQHGCRSFDRKIVEEGIGRTILTLPLEDQKSILLSWLGKFLKAGDNCPNLHRAFEVWWRRTFVRPFVEAEPASVTYPANATHENGLKISFDHTTTTMV